MLLGEGPGVKMPFPWMLYLTWGCPIYLLDIIGLKGGTVARPEVRKRAIIAYDRG